jgi:hypothetical protein
MSSQSDFEVRFTDREITAWGGMALMQKMLQSIQFSDAAKQWNLPQPGSFVAMNPYRSLSNFWSVSGAEQTVLPMQKSPAFTISCFLLGRANCRI